MSERKISMNPNRAIFVLVWTALLPRPFKRLRILSYNESGLGVVIETSTVLTHTLRVCADHPAVMNSQNMLRQQHGHNWGYRCMDTFIFTDAMEKE